MQHEIKTKLAQLQVATDKEIKNVTPVAGEKLNDLYEEETQKPTPMPWKQIVVVFIIFICDIFAFSTLSPIVGMFICILTSLLRVHDYGFWVSTRW
jgi:hypothetical protein